MKGSKRFRTLAVILVSDFCFHDFVLFRIVVYFVYIIRLVDVMCTKAIDPVCLIQKEKKISCQLFMKQPRINIS